VKTLADLPFYSAERFPDRAVLRQCQGDTSVDMSGRTLLGRVRDLSLGFGELGLVAGDRVAVIADSRTEWCVTDLAVLTAGGVTVPIYPTLTSAHVRDLLNDCGARVVVASDRAQVEKVSAIRAQLPTLATIVVMDTDGRSWPEDLMTLADLAARGRQRLSSTATAERAFEQRVTAMDPGALATIIYTSGTGGEPKGVMLSHHNLLSNVRAAISVLGVTADDVALSFLPLSHAFERMVVYTYLYAGATVAFAESSATLARDMVKVRPTLMTAVPRVFEKLYAQIHETVADTPAIRRAIFRWAIAVGLRRSGIVRWRPLNGSSGSP
jgi:long-chain acyl-CoA synthetase